jgi:predicted Fe-S protein YdhL (DUF1289 family)
MEVVEPGHIYNLNHIDGENQTTIVFVNREEGTEHEGTQTQEVTRMLIDMIECLIDRTNHCDGCIRWEGNDRIIKSFSEAQRQLRLTLLHHEARAMERKMERGDIHPERIAVNKDGHFKGAEG